MTDNPNRSRTERFDLVSERFLEQDLSLSEQYQAFSAELLRLSLAGLGVVGIICTEVLLRAGADSAVLSRLTHERRFFVLGTLLLGAAAATALMHRYFAIDAVAHQVCYLRLVGKKESAQLEGQAVSSRRAEEELKDMRADLKRSARALSLASIFLAAGVLSVGGSFLIVAFGVK